MSATQPIPQVVEVFGDWTPLVTAAYRPLGNAYGRRSGWFKAMTVGRVQVSRTTLKRLKDQGFTRVKLSTNDVDHTFVIEELLNA